MTVLDLELVRRVEKIASAKRCTPAQLALAWLLSRGEDVVPIPGSKSRARLEENAKALGVALTADELMQIDEAAPKGIAAGARYPEVAMRALDV